MSNTVSDKQQIRLYYSFREDERNTALVYRAVAQKTTDKQMASVFEQMALTEDRHAQRWENLLTEKGEKLRSFSPSFRTRFLLFVLKRFGVQSVLPILVSLEKKGAGGYGGVKEAAGMQGQERAHAIVIEELSKTTESSSNHHLPGIEGRHRTPGGNALRAAVMGASDGLLSNFNLTMGVAGAAVANNYILLTGLAGLLAGAVSMAIGEWISVKSSEELYKHQFATEKAELEYAPEDELEELVVIYKARGYDEEHAKNLANSIFKDKDRAIETLVMEEVGSDVMVEEGSAITAALTSFSLFAVGAIIPVAPYFFLSGIAAIITSAVLSIIGLFTLGAVITVFTGRTVWYSGIRQVLIGILAGGITFLVGHLIGVGLS